MNPSQCPQLQQRRLITMSIFGTTVSKKNIGRNQSGPGGVPKLDITGVEAYNNVSAIRRPANTRDGTIVLIDGNKLRTKPNGSEASQR
jgi:hypothetical protein